MVSGLRIHVFVAMLMGLTVGHQNLGGQQAFGINNNEPHVHSPPSPQQQQYQTVSPQQGGQIRGSEPQQGAQFQVDGHNHQQPTGVFDRSQIQDREHIKEHLDGVAQADTSKMSDQELQFHYFKMHDSDNNNKLDGSELIKSLIHWHENEDEKKTVDGVQIEINVFSDDDLSLMIDPILLKNDRDNNVTEENHPNNPNRPLNGPKVFEDNELEVLIDPILRSDDTNRDGFIDYTEFSAAQARIASNQGNQPQH